MTKKLLSPIDLGKPEKLIRGQLIPSADSTGFVEISSGKKWKAGLVVFTGRDVTVEDICEKLVASNKFPVDDQTRNRISQMLEQLATFKIGDIVGLGPNQELVRLAKPARSVSKLPN
ncbi:MAG: hypothetical protein JNL64_15485 [Blastocatellia bacterium]|nr:hypothetical protein [Blastocatellia bacterium]